LTEIKQTLIEVKSLTKIKSKTVLNRRRLRKHFAKKAKFSISKKSCLKYKSKQTGGFSQNVNKKKVKFDLSDKSQGRMDEASAEIKNEIVERFDESKYVDAIDLCTPEDIDGNINDFILDDISIF
jgi:hypothetical protein